MSRRRPKIAIALAIAAAALLALSVVSAADAGYYFDDGSLMLPEHHQGHVYLRPFGDPPELSILAALAMLAAAGHLGIARRRVRIGSVIAVGVPATLVALLCCGTAPIRGMFNESDASTVAESSRYELVRYYRPSQLFGTDDIVLHLRSRNGLMSYEGGADLGCFVEDSSGAESQWLFDHASLIADNKVVIVAQDGTTWQVRFDPRTLRPTNPVDRCTNAPDPVGDD